MEYYDSDDFPYVESNFISENECNKIINYINNTPNIFNDNDIQIHEFWTNRVVLIKDIKDQNIFDILVNSNDRVTKKVNDLSLIDKPLYPDVLNIVKWGFDRELKPHADKENPDNVPHPFPWRDFATVIYLNDDYKGGQIYFPNQKLQFRPSKCSLAIFPGTLEFLHGVKEVTEGVRYTITSFYTYDEEHGVKSWR